MKYNFVSVHSRTKFQIKIQINKVCTSYKILSKFSKNSKSQIFESFNRFWPHSVPQVLVRYIIFVCSFRTIAQTLRKLELPQTFSKYSKSHKITNRPSIVMKIVTIKGLSLLHWCTKIHFNISSHL